MILFTDNTLKDCKYFLNAGHEELFAVISAEDAVVEYVSPLQQIAENMAYNIRLKGKQVIIKKFKISKEILNG